MEKETLIAELKERSKGFFDKKDFINAGRINIAIDVLEEMLPQVAEKSCTNRNRAGRFTGASSKETEHSIQLFEIYHKKH